MGFDQMPESLDIIMTRIGSIEKLLERIADTKPETDEIMNAEQLSAWIGWKVGTINKKVSAKQIPHSRPVGSNPIFLKRDILNWIIEHNVPLKGDALAEREAKLIKGHKRAAASK